MSHKEQIRELKEVNETINDYDSLIKYLEWKKSKFSGEIFNELTFDIKYLGECLALLINLKENKVFVPICSNIDHELAYNYCVLVDSNIKDTYRAKKNNLNNTDEVVVVYDSNSSKGRVNYNLTYQFLLDEYGIDKGNYNGHVDKSNFDNRPYIKDFISFLAENQINKEMKFTYHDMLECLREYISLDKNKRKKLKM